MYFGIAAIALSMAACSSDDEVAQQPEQMGVVKTSFNISVPGSPKTRMSDNRVQYHAVGQDPTFLGIDSIELIPFGKAGEIASTDVRLGANLVLGQLGATPAINKNNSITECGRSNVDRTATADRRSLNYVTRICPSRD